MPWLRSFRCSAHCVSPRDGWGFPTSNFSLKLKDPAVHPETVVSTLLARHTHNGDGDATYVALDGSWILEIQNGETHGSLCMTGGMKFRCNYSCCTWENLKTSLIGLSRWSERPKKSLQFHIPATLNNYLFNGCLVISNHFPSKGLVHHPTETTNLK